ncbi:MAG TPA: DUF5719 family protein [Trebonia sp.]
MSRASLPPAVLHRLALHRLALPSAVLLALAAVFLVAWGTRPGPAPAPASGDQEVAVTSITRSCPPAAPGAGASRVALIALSAPTAAAGPATAPPDTAPPAGSAVLSTVSAASAPKAAAAKPFTVSAPGKIATVTAAGGTGTAVAATGKMAMGFEAEQSDAAGTGLVSCTHAGSDMWFVGTGQATGASQTWLYLMNTGDVTATADLTILTDSGVQPGPGSAVTIQPNQFAAENVTPYVPGSQAVALHVQTSSGQVAASAWQGGSGGGAWLPQAAAPSASLVIPGLTVASSAAKLLVVVPGATDAQLKIVAYTPDGAVPQFPGSPVDASAGAATPVALNSLGASAAGLKLTSSVPVVAGVLVPGAGIGSFTTAQSPVSEQGVVAGNPSTRGVTVGLLLTAPAAAAQVSVSVISADGTVTAPAADQGVAVKASHTVALSLPRPQGSNEPFAITVTPAAGSGPVYAVRVVTSGTGGLSAPVTSLLPVASALTSITLPPARDAYSAVLP